MKEFDNLKKVILNEYPRMTEESRFSFACHAAVPCFNACCADVNIFLSPYDIMRLRTALGVTSSDFLAKYTLSPFDKNLPYPVILLKMDETEQRKCPFVTQQGCSVYENRPWACRMYPLGLASPKEGSEVGQEFYFLLREAVCKGFEEKRDISVAEWLDNQGIREYNAAGEAFKGITLHEFFEKGGELTPAKVQMFFQACYDLDRFRTFLFSSSFFNKFDVDAETRSAIETDDQALLDFAYCWLRFALYGEKTMVVREDVLEEKKREMAKPKDGSAR